MKAVRTALPPALAACLILSAAFLGCEHPRQSRRSASRTSAEWRSITAAPMSPEEAPPAKPFDTEAYDHVEDNPFCRTTDRPLSTFAIDVDTASYANVRRFLNNGKLPPAGAVRIEEMVNYFTYDYAPPDDGAADPFAVHIEAAGCPWAPAHRLVRIGIKAREIPPARRPPANLVFLLDVSGSMQDANKLPLVKAAMKMLVERLNESGWNPRPATASRRSFPPWTLWPPAGPPTAARASSWRTRRPARTSSRAVRTG